MDELELGMCQSLSSELKKTISKKNMWYTVYKLGKMYPNQTKWNTVTKVQVAKSIWTQRSTRQRFQKNQTNANDLIIPTWYGRLKTAILQATPCGTFTNKATVSSVHNNPRHFVDWFYWLGDTIEHSYLDFNPICVE